MCVCVEGQAVGIVTVDRSVFMGLPKFTTSQLFCLLITYYNEEERKKTDWILKTRTGNPVTPVSGTGITGGGSGYAALLAHAG